MWREAPQLIVPVIAAAVLTDWQAVPGGRGEGQCVQA